MLIVSTIKYVTPISYICITNKNNSEIVKIPLVTYD